MTINQAMQQMRYQEELKKIHKNVTELTKRNRQAVDLAQKVVDLAQEHARLLSARLDRLEKLDAKHEFGKQFVALAQRVGYQQKLDNLFH